MRGLKGKGGSSEGFIYFIFLLAVTKYHNVKKYWHWLVIVGSESFPVEKAEGVKHQWQEHLAAIF